MPQAMSLRNRGLYLHGSYLGGDVPEGAMSRADNVVLDRENIIEPRRGMPVYGQAISGLIPSATRRLISFSGSLFAHNSNQLYRDIGAGAWAFERSATPPSTEVRLRDVEYRGNLYVTSSEGILKLDGVGRPWRAAGVPRPLDSTGALTGGSGFLADQRSVAYRATLHYTDANKREVVSAPSQRLIVFNGSGGTRNVNLTVYLPTGLTADYFYRVYRSATSASSSAIPSDELQLVKERQLTATDITNGYATLTDSTPDALRGAALYTNDTQETIANANYQPPRAVDVFEFKEHTFYVNVTGKQRYSTQLIGVGAGSLTFVTTTGDTTLGSPVVPDIASTANLHVGMKAKSASIPATARILTIDGPNQVTLTEGASATTGNVAIEFQDLITIAGREYYAASATNAANREFLASTGGTPSANLEDTARALAFVVNRDTGNTQVYAFYSSGAEDIPGGLLFEERGIGGAAFGVSSTSPGSFHSPLPTDGTTDLSEATIEPAGVYVSKSGLPEAVPLGTLRRARDTKLLRGFALRDSGILLGEKRIHRISGTSIADFSIDPLDETTQLKGPETAVKFNDRVYCNSSQGIIAVSDGSVAVVSRNIETDLKMASSELFPTFSDVAHAVGYESDRAYWIWVQDDPAEVEPSIAYRYNAFTASWTRQLRPATCALVHSADDKLYTGDYATGKLRKERKSFSRDDYAEDEFTRTIASASGTTVTLDSTAGISEGYVIRQSFSEGRIEEVLSGTQIRVDAELFFVPGTATIYVPIESTLQWVPITAGNPGLQKVHPEISLFFRNADFAHCFLGVANNVEAFPLEIELEPIDKGGGWGDFPWGDVPWGGTLKDDQVIRTEIPLDMRQAHWLLVSLRFQEVFSKFGVVGFSAELVPQSSKFQAGNIK